MTNPQQGDRAKINGKATNKDESRQASEYERSGNASTSRPDSPLESPRPWHTEGLPKNDKKKPKRWIFWVCSAALFALIWGIFSWQDARNAPPSIAYTEFSAQVKAGNVKEIYAKGDTIQGELKAARPIPNEDGSKSDREYAKFTTERPTFAKDDPLAKLAASDGIVKATPVIDQRGPIVNFVGTMLMWGILIGIAIWFFRRMNRTGPFGMGREVKPIEQSNVRVNFDDVAGIDEVEAQVGEIVDFLKNPSKYAKLGARAPKGVLLEGAPGTGKTLLARATAGEAEVPFFSASASEFIEMIVGVGAQRVRQLFEEARKVAPAIIFIDEIDAIGRSRGSARVSGGNDEREQTLNQILTEMDGFDGTEGVIVIGATNRADVLDNALTRPGRFDRVITVNAPDMGGREQILKVHTRKIPLADDVDLHRIASVTPGATGADLANLANEAALQAARREDESVRHTDFMNALEQIQLGIERNVVIPEEERRRTAYHESGHALLGMLRKGADPVRKVSIIPRGQALGVTLSTPDADRYGYDEDYLRGRIIGALGGMAAENAIYGVVTTGAESDLRQATAIARQMVGKWGMSEKVGPMTVLIDDADPRTIGISDVTLRTVDEEVRRIIAECQEQAVRMLEDHRDQLCAIAEELMVKETLNEEEVYAVAGIERPANRPARAEDSAQ